MMSVVMLDVIKLSVVMLIVVMLNVIVLSVIMLNVIVLCVIMLSVVVLNVVVLSVGAPLFQVFFSFPDWGMHPGSFSCVLSRFTTDLQWLPTLVFNIAVDRLFLGWMKSFGA
jgi:hypothetical protein